MKLKVTEDNIFVKLLKEKDGVVHIPPVFRRKNQLALEGKVILAGPAANVKVGDQIIFHKLQENQILLNGDELLMIKPYSILAIK